MGLRVVNRDERSNSHVWKRTMSAWKVNHSISNNPYHINGHFLHGTHAVEVQAATCNEKGSQCNMDFQSSQAKPSAKIGITIMPTHLRHLLHLQSCKLL